MRRGVHVLIVAMGIAVFAALPAMADKPDTFTPTPLILDGVNPCDGSAHQIALDAVVSTHQHRNNGLFHVSYEGSTSSGFTLRSGVENATRNKNVVRGTFSFQWRHSDGSKFMERGVFVVNFKKAEMMVDVLSARCIGSG